MTTGVEPGWRTRSWAPVEQLMSPRENRASHDAGSSAAGWRHGYRRRVQLTDLLSVLVAMIAAPLVRFGTGHAVSYGDLAYLVLSVILAAAWMAVLGASGSWNGKIIGNGVDEYRRVTLASLLLFGLVAIAVYLAKLDVARGHVAVALPLGLVLLWTTRGFWRGWLRRGRARGRCMDRTIVVGSAQSALALARQLGSQPQAGFEILGLCSPDAESSELEEFPVLGGLDHIVEIALRTGATTVAVTKTPLLTPGQMNRLAWRLEGTRIHLVLAPMLMAIAGPRVHAEPIPGLPLIHVEKPRIGSFWMMVKTGFDFCAALVVLLLASPVMVAAAVMIKAHDGGPVFFKQERVGRGGRAFRIWKFRSMVVDADRDKDREKARAGQHGGTVFFKSSSDSRITKIGRVLRATSIDELPQLFNVLKGEMSLVGPRPLVPNEGAELADFVARRALVKPGLTGLWQVSGRSEITGEQRARLDLQYVENWSLTGDLAILARTVRVVLLRKGSV